jgi:hypothetical protein
MLRFAALSEFIEIFSQPPTTFLISSGPTTTVAYVFPNFLLYKVNSLFLSLFPSVCLFLSLSSFCSHCLCLSSRAPLSSRTSLV